MLRQGSPALRARWRCARPSPPDRPDGDEIEPMRVASRAGAAAARARPQWRPHPAGKVPSAVPTHRHPRAAAAPPAPGTGETSRTMPTPPARRRRHGSSQCSVDCSFSPSWTNCSPSRTRVPGVEPELKARRRVVADRAVLELHPDMFRAPGAGELAKPHLLDGRDELHVVAHRTGSPPGRPPPAGSRTGPFASGRRAPGTEAARNAPRAAPATAGAGRRTRCRPSGPPFPAGPAAPGEADRTPGPHHRDSRRSMSPCPGLVPAPAVPRVASSSRVDCGWSCQRAPVRQVRCASPASPSPA